MLCDDILLNIFRHYLDATPQFWPTLTSRMPKVATGHIDITSGSKSSTLLHARDARLEDSRLLATPYLSSYSTGDLQISIRPLLRTTTISLLR
jgi:hypothetical protein